MTAPSTTLAVFNTLLQAEIARGRLRAEGISSVLVDSALLQLGIVADGIALHVAVTDLKRARDVLATDYSGDLDDKTLHGTEP